MGDFNLSHRIALAARFALTCILATVAQAADPPVDFNRQVRPILEEHCFRCHGPEKQQAGLRLDIKERALQGGESGEPAIIPGNPDKSPLIVFIRGEDPDVFMPPEGERVPAKQVEVLVRWIKEGANWPSAPSKK